MKKILVIGSDERQKELARLYGTILFNETEKDLKKQIKKAKNIILPIGEPSERLSAYLRVNIKKGTVIFGGNYSNDFAERIIHKGAIIFDITKAEKFARENAVPTAMGAIAIANEKADLGKSKILVLGYGNCGKAIVSLLKEQKIEPEIYDKILDKKLEDINLDEIDVIFNTIPEQILDNIEEKIIINIASVNAGFPEECRYPNIPAKMFPETSAKIMKNAIDELEGAL